MNKNKTVYILLSEMASGKLRYQWNDFTPEMDTRAVENRRVLQCSRWNTSVRTVVPMHLPVKAYSDQDRYGVVVAYSDG